ncbi:retrovirus-related pol polyprotein from transposon TNT 1-94, partial [Tanacetum coccineum]
MTTVNQGMSVEEIEQTERQEDKVAKNTSNKRKWEGNHNRSSSQQNKGHKVPRAHTTRPISKKAYAGSLLLCNQCKFYHNGLCTVKCRNCKKVGHIIQNCKTPATTRNQRTRTCYECGSLRHYKSECPIVKFQKRVDMIHGGVRASKPKTMQDAIEFVTKLMDKKISTPAERQAENKRKLDNTSKNNQNQQQPNKRQNTGRAYIWQALGERKHYAYLSRVSINAIPLQQGHWGKLAKATCYECGNQGHYRNDCPERKNQNHENQTGGTGARGGGFICFGPTYHSSPQGAENFIVYCDASHKGLGVVLMQNEKMSSMQEDIQCAGSDTRPPMLDRTDFESWQQRIRLYCLGKDNGENIMKSIKEGPFQMGTVSDVITGGTEGAVQQGPVRARVLNDLSAEEKERYKADIRATNILLQGIPKDIYSLINHYIDAKDIWENMKMILEGSELTKDDRESQLYDEFEHFRQIKGETIQGYYVRFTKLINDMRNIKMTMSRMQLNSKFVNNMLPEWSRFITEVKLNRGEQVTNVDDDVDDSPENDLALNVDHIFEADECDAFDSDVDEGPTSQTMFMANLTSEDPIYNEAGPSYDSNNPFEVQDHMDEYHEVHKMQNDVQHNYIVDSDADYMSDSNIIPYDQYVEDNEEHVVQCNASSVRNDALMSILDEMHEQGVQSRL